MLRKVIFCLALYTAAIQSSGQEKYAFKSLRFDEDYSFLRDDSTKSAYDHVKFIPVVNSKSYLSLGGEERLQFFHIRNEDWGETGKPSDTYLLNRALLHADLRVGAHFRTFVQLQSGLAFDKDLVSPVDENKLDLHQAFVDIKNEHILLRIGRQELQYGSQRLVSVRELPNNRQAFDAALISIAKSQFKLDFLFGNYVFAIPGVFDDKIQDDVSLWGAYLVTTSKQIVNIDAYYLGIRKKNAQFDNARGEELRHSFGARFWKNTDSWRLDFEGVYQFGSLNELDIYAWTISSNSGYKFRSIKLQPEIGLKTELISGNRSYSDGELETFNPLFPRGAYFGLAALIGPSNLVDIHPSLTISLSENIQWGIDYDLFWRLSTNDGIYTPAVTLIYSGEGIRSKTIGRQLATSIDWDTSSFLTIVTEFTWFDSGDFLKSAGPGKDILFAGVTAQLKF